MPNMPYYGYENNQNPNLLSVYLEIKNKVEELERKINELNDRINTLENKTNSQNYEYQTSMNMM